MDARTIGALVAVGVVLVIGLLARNAGSASGRPDGTVPPPDAADGGTDDFGRDDGEDDDDEETAEVVAVTSDGYALVPDLHAVRLVPPPDDGDGWKEGRAATHKRGQRGLDMSWHAGDFTGARVVRGAADEGPWRCEALGRDGEYTAFVFETREGADAARALFESRGVVRLGRDEDGREMPPSPEQFEEARRVFLETEAALDHDDD